MNIVKEQILGFLTMEQILNKYGIKINRSRMYSCPFHTDNSPSAKCYKDSFHCFSCGKHGDLIEFVKSYYNLNFQQAMDKINEDFGLGLTTTGHYDKSKIIEMEKQRQLEIEKEENKRKLFKRACKRKNIYEHLIENYKKQLNTSNWEELTCVIAYCQDKVELLNLYICDTFNMEY